MGQRTGADTMSMIDFATKMRQLIEDKREQNRMAMEKGVDHDTYLKLVGRNNELREMKDWINDVVQEIDSEEGEDEL